MSSTIQITDQNAPAFHLTDAEVLAMRPHCGAATLTRELAHASGQDAANRQMRREPNKPSAIK